MNRDLGLLNWQPPGLPAMIPCADMPGGKLSISDAHIRKANAVFPPLMDLLRPLPDRQAAGRTVISVCGGSGSGKSGTAAVLAYYLRHAGLETYCLSGDNYPHRIPLYNDAERLRVFRLGGVHGLMREELYTPETRRALSRLQTQGRDSDPQGIGGHPWLERYITWGRQALAAYLGTPEEIDFSEINSLVDQFKSGGCELFLKRMGRDPASLWYEKVGFGGIRVLIIEWTHAGSAYLQGVDIPVMLMSTPQETLYYRQTRNRDNAIDSAFTSLVLDIEQEKLMAQLPKAKIIISFEGEVMDSPLSAPAAQEWGGG